MEGRLAGGSGPLVEVEQVLQAVDHWGLGMVPRWGLHGGWAASTNGQGRPGPFEGGRWQGSGWCDNVGHLVEVLVEGLVGKVDV